MSNVNEPKTIKIDRTSFLFGLVIGFLSFLMLSGLAYTFAPQEEVKGCGYAEYMITGWNETHYNFTYTDRDGVHIANYQVEREVVYETIEFLLRRTIEEVK